MSWFKVDDRLWSHPKWLNLSLEGKALWISAGSYCAMHETDGFVSCQTLAILLPNSRQTRAANALVEAQLWEQTSGGYRFRNWGEYQPTKAQKDAERAAWREKKRERRSRKVSPGDSLGDTPGDSRKSPAVPDPTRPGQSNDCLFRGGAPNENSPGEPVDNSTAKAVATNKKIDRGTRLPNDWMPDADLVEWTNREIGGTNIDPSRELERFRDYWTAVTGQNGVRKDWRAVWRNWIRRQADQSARGYRNQDQIRRDMFVKAEAATRARIGNPLALIQGEKP